MKVMVKFLPKNFFMVIFIEEDQKRMVLNGGIWKMNDTPLYMQPWCQNFDPTGMIICEKPLWLRFYNMPMEYWAGGCLEKIDRTLGTLMNIDMEILEGDFEKYMMIQAVVVKEIPKQITLMVHGSKWLQTI
ncbi:hypothetical protein SUGI_0922680 [Cryptomeria japonica]|nr:hypothetical protein SUGI_0922680 [Cryptomeria japonica]